MADNRFITLDELIANAITIIPNADDSDRNIFRTWVYNCLTDIGILYEKTETCKITAHDRSVRKPQRCLSVKDIGLYNKSDQELVYIYRGKRGEDIVHHGKKAVGIRPIYVSEDEYYFHFDSDNGNEVSYAILEFYSIPTDENGEVFVPYYMVEAVNMYLRWYWSLRQNESRSEIAQNMAMYKDAKVKVKAKNRVPSLLQGKAMMQKWVSMITRVQFNRP